MYLHENIQAGHAAKSSVVTFYTGSTEDFLYFDVCDKNLLHAFANHRHEHIVIGIDDHFIRAVRDCSIWNLYDILYDIEDCFHVQTVAEPVSKLSAVGFLKRIVSFNRQYKISFIFKNHPQIQHEGKRTFTKLCASNISINFTTISEEELQIFPLQLKQTFQSVMNTDDLIEYVVIKLNDVPLIDRRLVIHNMLTILHDIQSTMQKEKQLNIFIRKKISDSVYTLCDIHEYEPAEQLLQYDHRSIMDYMTEAWEDNSLMVSI